MWKVTAALAAVVLWGGNGLAQPSSSTASRVRAATVAQLPSATVNAGISYAIKDGASASDCTVGGGSTPVTCTAIGGVWVATAGSGGGGGAPTGAAGGDLTGTYPNPGVGAYKGHSAPTGAEFDLVSGVTSAIQTQLGALLNQQMSNLSGTVAVNLALTPGTTNSINLDSKTKAYIDGYFTGVLGFLTGTTCDGGVSRLGAASLAIGNCTAGDSSGKLTLAEVDTASGGVAGYVGIGAGTAQSTVASTVGFTTGTSVTAYNNKVPSASWTGLLRGDTASSITTWTGAELSGDVTTSGSNAATVIQIQGKAIDVPTTAGDIYAYNGTAIKRIGVGTDGQRLIADSAQSTGLKWSGITVDNQGPLSGVTAVSGVDTTIYTTSVPAVPSGKCVRVYWGFQHTTGSASTVYKLILGSTAVFTGSGTANVGISAGSALVCNNTGSQSAQTAYHLTSFAAAASAGAGTTGTASEAWSGALNLKLTFNIANNTDVVTPKFWFVENVN